MGGANVSAGKLPHFLLHCLRLSRALRSLEHTGLPQRATGATCLFLGKTENSACQSLALWVQGCLDQQRPGPAKSHFLLFLPVHPTHLSHSTHPQLQELPSLRSSPPHPGDAKPALKKATSFFQKSVEWSQGRVERPCGEGLRLPLRRESLPLALGKPGRPLPGLVTQPECSLAGPGPRAARLCSATPSSWTKAEAPLPGASGPGPLGFPQREGGGCRRASCSCGKPHTTACRCRGLGEGERIH